MRRVIFWGVVVAAIGGFAFVSWKALEPSPTTTTTTTAARQSPSTVEQTSAKPSTVGTKNSPVATKPEQSLRQRFRESKDYAQFVASIAPLATAGNVEAQYLTAKSLRWCAEMSRLYFRKSNGEVRTLEEVQANAAARPSGLSPEAIAMIHTRCRGFLEDEDLHKMSLTWNQWLDKAADGGNPAAIALNASLLQTQLMLESHSSLPHPQRGVDAEAQARDLALSSVESGDPDAIFLMSDWVRAGERSEQATTTLVYAWKMLACQSGYDCGPTSDWMLSACSWDPQCADGRTYTDYLQRQLGSQYDDAVRLARSIGEAVAAKDTQALKSNL
jgi:TPR repeat protein